MSEKKSTVKNMSDRELLEELVRLNRAKHILTIILCVAAVAVVIAVIISMAQIVPRTLESLDKVNHMTSEIETSLADVSKIDFDTLNTAIADFSKVVGSLAKWFR